MADASGAFYAELAVSPRELFDSLVIEGSWTGLVDRLVEIGGGVQAAD